MPTEKRPGHMPPHLPGGDLMTKVVRTPTPGPQQGHQFCLSPWLVFSVPNASGRPVQTCFHLISCQRRQNLFILPVLGADDPSPRFGLVLRATLEKQGDTQGWLSSAVLRKSKPERFRVSPPHLLLVGFMAPGLPLCPPRLVFVSAWPPVKGSIRVRFPSPLTVQAVFLT